MTIIEAIKKVIQAHGSPMTVNEIYDAIVSDGLYKFKAQQPSHVVASQVRRHCKGLDFQSANRTKHFVLTENGKFSVLTKPVVVPTRKATTNRRKPSRALGAMRRDINEIKEQYEEEIRRRILKELKKFDPTFFEKFCKRLLDVYGFSKMKVTRAHKDGGVDGFGKLKIGFVEMSVAFQCKRWTKNSIGRPEIDKFRGAIQGEYEQGIFFTTAKFAKGAEKVSFKPGAVPIIMIDGPSIVDIMIEKQFGVEIESISIPSYALDLALTDD